ADVVAERPHVVEEEVREWVIGLLRKRGYRVRPAPQRSNVAAVAPDLSEDRISCLRLRTSGRCRRRRQERHEVGETLDVVAVVFEPGDEVAGCDERGVALRS